MDILPEIEILYAEFRVFDLDLAVYLRNCIRVVLVRRRFWLLYLVSYES